MAVNRPLLQFMAFSVVSLFYGCSGQNPEPVKTPQSLENQIVKDQNEPIPRRLDSASGSANPSTKNQPESSTGTGPVFFTDVLNSSEITFSHVSGTTPEKPTPSANGSGVAVLDFDQDGLMDLYFAQSTQIPVDPHANQTGRLYRNLGGWKFQDVTVGSGLDQTTCFTHAALAADIDNDGDTDLYLCNFGENRLFRNDGGGKFSDISRSSGTAFDGWSSSGAFLDFDRDGLLDLYISTYADWKYPEDNRFCGDQAKKVRLYCDPKELRPAPDVLFRNLGAGRFEDVSKKTGINRPDGHGFGVIAADLNADGLTDLYVANDQDPNFLFINRGDGTFEDTTAIAGAALDSRGHAQAGMGVDAEDIDGDGLPEIIVTNFINEPNTLYKNLGQGLFMDVTSAWGILAPSVPYVGWGTTLSDFDLDGWPDLFVANGHLDDNRHELGEDAPQPEPPLLFQNLSGKRFKEVGAGAGAYLASAHVGRGVAWSDLDNDGDIDLIVCHKDAPPALLRNDSPRLGRHWIQIQLVGTKSNRDAIGTRIELHLENRTITRLRKGGCGLMSTHDPRLTIGLDHAQIIPKLRVYWPSGKTTELNQVETDKTLIITEPNS